MSSTDPQIHKRWEKKLARRKTRRDQALAQRKANARRLVRSRQAVNHARSEVQAARRVLDRHPLTSAKPLRLRAHDEAVKCIGIVERGGNNRGPDVERIIRANGGVPGEPWCGDGMAYCYMQAGSKGVDRSWASVALVGSDVDVRHTASPKTGNLVRFTFDHVGMFERFCTATGADASQATATFIETIEFNTTSSGAVSDSASGQDGVKRKIRPRSLVRDYLEVLR